ncbi:MAG TPA: flavin reductase [Candidatus Marinimicrobia bacterium]|jgi:flavin reductase (DIM6/NTAB) family NADH-FMN oxidoreductase RutF|nr:flavin reductase [Candidatus Neomarinimicrobiota bacterium]
MGKQLMNEKYRKQSLRMFSYGVYVLSSMDKGEYCVSTVTWVSQASFEPPLISVCIKRGSASYEIVKKRGEFILHLLGDDQKDLALSFFKSTVLEHGKLNGHEFRLHNEMPLLKEAPAYIICKVVEILENGDHPLFLAEVIDAVVNSDSKPLELSTTGWSYGG